MTGDLAAWWLRGAAIAAAAALLSAVLILVLRPFLERHALARPNARSSHKIPTPQGGGIGVIAATMVVGFGTVCLTQAAGSSAPLLSVFAAAIVLAGVGAADDIRSIGIVPRLFLQTLAVALLIFTLPAELRVVPMLPWAIERVLLVIGGLWFVNLVNFMDGLDWMTVAEIVPITLALAVIASFDILPRYAGVVAFALCGAMIGFAYFNRPVAKLFLGDVGSLPIGLLTGWLLLLLAGRGHLAAAIILPLYYLADATLTLIRRLVRGEPVWQAHRSHFYQIATDRGFTVRAVVARVLAVNIGLVALAAFTVIRPGIVSDATALLAGGVVVGWLLVTFARGRDGKR